MLERLADAAVMLVTLYLSTLRGGMVFDANLLQIAVVGALGLVLAVAFFNKTAEESLRSTLFTWLLLAPWG